MKTFTTITVIGLLAWVGFALLDISSVTFLFISPAIFGIVAIIMYWVMTISLGSHREQFATGKLCTIAFVIAMVLSFFSFVILDDHLAHNLPFKDSLDFRWLSATFSGFVGLSVFVFFYWFGAVMIKDHKKAIEAKQARLLQRERTQQANLLQKERARQSYLDATESLFQNPEQSLETLYSKHEFLESGAPPQIALETFIKFINGKNFQKADKLLGYYDVDTHQLLRVAKALEKFEKDNKLDLEPTTFKLTLEDGETAYEKLPCNWQKIHTYLAPLTDEHEQADILDSGNIYITDQRVFFVGKKGSETVYIDDIAFMDHKEDALQFFRNEGLSEIFAFPTPHHATYARILIETLQADIA